MSVAEDVGSTLETPATKRISEDIGNRLPPHFVPKILAVAYIFIVSPKRAIHSERLPSSCNILPSTDKTGTKPHRTRLAGLVELPDPVVDDHWLKRRSQQAFGRPVQRALNWAKNAREGLVKRGKIV